MNTLWNILAIIVGGILAVGLYKLTMGNTLGRSGGGGEV